MSQVDRSTVEVHGSRVSYLRKMYSLFSLELITGTVVAALCIGYLEEEGEVSFIVKYYGIAIATIVISLILMVVSYVLRRRRTDILSWLIWVLFYVCISYSLGFIALAEPAMIVMFILTTFTCISVGITLYSLTSNTYLESTTAFLVIFGSSLLSFEAFLIFTQVKFILLVIFYAITLVFGFYINYDVRNVIRQGSATERTQENYVLGSIKIYVEIVLVFFRLLELLARSFRREKH